MTRCEIAECGQYVDICRRYGHRGGGQDPGLIPDVPDVTIGVEYVPFHVVAAEVADRCNNPAMERMLRLYLAAVEREGFAIVRDALD